MYKIAHHKTTALQKHHGHMQYGHHMCHTYTYGGTLTKIIPSDSPKE